MEEFKAALYVFRNGILSRRCGYIRPINRYKSEFYEYKKEVDRKIGMIKPYKRINPVFVTVTPGKVYSHFVWFPIKDENSVDEENEQTLRAAMLFRKKISKDIKKKENELNRLYLSEIALNELI